MRDWIVIAVLYLFGALVFRLLGGVGAAADAFREWGRAASQAHRARPTSS
jgi:hypothetical protein